MFYAHYVLNKKGPLARIWLAAHWDKKLTKANVFETNIEKSVEGILQPKVKLALRTSGHLMLGVVRIYSKKEKYLLADCNEAFLKIKMAFRPGMVDLPAEKREAAVNSITLPEVFHDFDSAIPELNDVDIQAQFSFNQSRAEEITMREDYGNISLMATDDGFGDMGFDSEPPELMRDAPSLDPSLENPGLMFEGGVSEKPQDAVSASDASHASFSARLAEPSAMQLDAPIRDDGFGGHLGQDIMAGGLFEGGLFDDPPVSEPVQPELSGADVAASSSPPPDGHQSDDEFGRYDAPPSPLAGAHGSDGGSPPPQAEPATAEGAGEEPGDPAGVDPAADESVTEDPDVSTAHDQTTLVRNEDETFALPPIDISTLKGMSRTKRKRKLIVDEVKNISGEEMKSQLSDTSDTVTTLDLAPPTKRLMHWKETGGVEKLFALPARGIAAGSLSQMYVRHLVSKPVEFDEFADEPAAVEETGRHQALLDQFRVEDAPQTPIAPESPQQRAGRRKRRRDTEEPEAVASADDIAHQHLQLQQLQLQLPPQTPAGGETPASVFNDPAPTPLPPAELSLPDASLSEEPTVEAPPSVEDPPSVHSAPGTPWQPDEEEEEEEPDEPEDQQQEDETDEQYEDRVNNRRAAAMMQAVRASFTDAPPDTSRLPFSQFCRGSNRKQVSQKFYTALVLKKLQALHLEQEKSYAEIMLSRGATFSSAQL